MLVLSKQQVYNLFLQVQFVATVRPQPAYPLVNDCINAVDLVLKKNISELLPHSNGSDVISLSADASSAAADPSVRPCSGIQSIQLYISPTSGENKHAKTKGRILIYCTASETFYFF